MKRIALCALLAAMAAGCKPVKPVEPITLAQYKVRLKELQQGVKERRITLQQAGERLELLQDAREESVYRYGN